MDTESKNTSAWFRRYCFHKRSHHAAIDIDNIIISFDNDSIVGIQPPNSIDNILSTTVPLATEMWLNHCHNLQSHHFSKNDSNQTTRRFPAFPPNSVPWLWQMDICIQRARNIVNFWLWKDCWEYNSINGLDQFVLIDAFLPSRVLGGECNFCGPQRQCTGHEGISSLHSLYCCHLGE